MRMNTLAESGGLLQPFVDFTRNYQESPDLRARADVEPRAVLSEHGIQVPPNQDVRIVANTAETFHLIMPPDPNAALAEEDLAAASAGFASGANGKTASTMISCVFCYS